MNSYKLLLFICLFVRLSTSFMGWFSKLQPSRNRIMNGEVKNTIIYKGSPFQKSILNKINGFYGIIGPEIDMKSVNSLYDLFIGNGNIQGIFIENGELIFVKRFIQTDKLLFEKAYFKPSTNMFMMLFFMMLNAMDMMPNMMGVSNTAFLNVNNKIYTLFERDKPYFINIDFVNKDIYTNNKVKIPFLKSFSGHSKFKNNYIETIDYSILDNSVTFLLLNEKFELIRKIKLRTHYIPVIHDFYTTNDKVIIIDSPLIYDIPNILNKKIPILFDKTRKTLIHALDKQNDNIRKTYYCNESFYLFHYGDYHENHENIEIYASLYDDLDFMNIHINGKYRKIVINKESGDVNIQKNPELEKYNLDFPIKYDNNKVVLRNIYNNTINGFVFCKELNIIHKLFFNNKFICGEPAIKVIENISYLLFFAFDNNNKNYFMIMNLNNYNIIEIPLSINIPLNIGFHSIYIDKCNK